MAKTKIENVTQSLFDLFSAIEDLLVDLTTPKGNPVNKDNEALVGMLQSINKLLDLSNAKEDSEKDMLAKINERVGKAYGVYIKVLKMTSEKATKDHDYINKTLTGLSDSFKKLLSDLNELHTGK
jgi:hypothetical protein